MLICSIIEVMSKTPSVSPEQPHLFSPEEVIDPAASLSQEQMAEFDRLDSQGTMNAIQIRQEIGGAALTEEPSDFIEWTEADGTEVAIHRNLINRQPTSKPNAPLEGYKPRSRKGLSGRQRLIADGPPEGYDGR